MSEEKSFKELLEEEEANVKQPHKGEVVEGIVIDVKDNEIILNIKAKSDGILMKNEYSNNPDVVLQDEVKVGDKLTVKVVSVNDSEGQIMVTYKRLQQDKINKRFLEAFENKEILTGTVAQALKGGLSVIYGEGRVFIPASLVSDIYERDLTKYENQEIQFVLTEVDLHKRRVIGDRKQLIVEERKKQQEELLSRIDKGMMVEGTVKNLTDFGAFIDLGGADGLLHISEMSWGRVDDPKKLFKVGDKVTVKIKDINDTKIALTMKLDENNPWKDAAEKYAVGNVITGKVARMTDFGAFIELEEGIDALLHVSQIAISHVEKPSDVLKVGQEVTAKIVDFNEDTKKISLSVKSLEIEKQRAEEAKARAEAAEAADDNAAPVPEDAPVDEPDTASVSDEAPADVDSSSEDTAENQEETPSADETAEDASDESADE
ncbi:MAG: 30S ribosomal protein S1 [Eubacterium sp.]|nr:30S ribosomal protein S1 [Eubacterium sp.]